MLFDSNIFLLFFVCLLVVHYLPLSWYLKTQVLDGRVATFSVTGTKSFGTPAQSLPEANR